MGISAERIPYSSASGLLEKAFSFCTMSLSLLESKVILPEFSMYDVPLAYVGVV